MLGGTSFVGRHIVDAALAAGHRVTLFNRGQTAPGLFEGVDERRGDRYATDLGSLADGEWDATVDVNGYSARHVAEMADVLGSRAGHYVFISTGSVYDPSDFVNLREDARRLKPDFESTEITAETYGPLKVAAEDTSLERYDRCTIVRPGIVAGPHDPSDRFTYWARRASLGGTVPVPGRPKQPVQVTDARDQAAFVAHLVEHGTTGIFNSVGPDELTTLDGLIDACADAAGEPLRVEWVAPALGDELGYQAPLVMPPDGSYDGLFRRSTQRADAAGMRHRPLAETARDTLEWDRARGLPPLKGAPSPEDEQKLLDAAEAG